MALNFAELPSWASMWLMAFTLFFICKGLTSAQALSAVPLVSAKRLLCYGLAWPGMDAREFLDSAKNATGPPLWIWAQACALSALGVMLMWGAASMAWPAFPLLTAGLGMVGTILLLHFGLFKLLACFWQSRGIRADAIMCAPIAACSVSEFWGRRWNRAFNRLAQVLIFNPARHHLGVKGAAFMVFLVSGIIHDLVISVPARAGYGQPTLYFVLQYLALMFERSALGKRLGLASGWRGRVFTMLAVIIPVSLLFHSAFVHDVMLPFMVAIDAIQGVQR